MARKKQVSKELSPSISKRARRPAKVSTKKSASVTADNVDTVDRPRRGRPVSVAVMKRKLELLQTRVQSEKLKRKQQLSNAQLKINTLLEEKRVLRNELKLFKARLQQMESEQKRAAKHELNKRRLEEARKLAVERFLTKWDKNHQVGTTQSGRKKRKQGRPRKS
ncbi:MAG: hypothetical protein P1R74_12235 [Sedimenticola sp.]|nr:hypothetical protein [Sedimenticola sp.]